MLYINFTLKYKFEGEEYIIFIGQPSVNSIDYKCSEVQEMELGKGTYATLYNLFMVGKKTQPILHRLNSLGNESSDSACKGLKVYFKN